MTGIGPLSPGNDIEETSRRSHPLPLLLSLFIISKLASRWWLRQQRGQAGEKKGFAKLYTSCVEALRRTERNSNPSKLFPP